MYEFNLNLEIAKNLGSPVIMVGKADKNLPVEEQSYNIVQSVDNFINSGCQVVKVIVNLVQVLVMSMVMMY